MPTPGEPFARTSAQQSRIGQEPPKREEVPHDGRTLYEVRLAMGTPCTSIHTDKSRNSRSKRSVKTKNWTEALDSLRPEPQAGRVGREDETLKPVQRTGCGRTSVPGGSGRCSEGEGAQNQGGGTEGAAQLPRVGAQNLRHLTPGRLQQSMRVRKRPLERLLPRNRCQPSQSRRM